MIDYNIIFSIYGVMDIINWYINSKVLEKENYFLYISHNTILHIMYTILSAQCYKDFMTLFDGHNDSCPFVIFICCYWKPCLTNVQQLLEFSLTLTLLFIEKALFEISSFIHFTLNKTQIFTLADVCRVQSIRYLISCQLAAH